MVLLLFLFVLVLVSCKDKEHVFVVCKRMVQIADFLDFIFRGPDC